MKMVGGKNNIPRDLNLISVDHLVFLVDRQIYIFALHMQLARGRIVGKGKSYIYTYIVCTTKDIFNTRTYSVYILCVCRHARASIVGTVHACRYI